MISKYQFWYKQNKFGYVISFIVKKRKDIFLLNILCFNLSKHNKKLFRTFENF